MTDRGTRREGWYADPLGQADLRWWDSRNWTTQVTASRSGVSRATAAPRPAPLQWAEDERPEGETVGDTNRVAVPPQEATAEPKLALGAKPAGSNAATEFVPDSAADWSALTLALLSAGDDIVTASAASIPTITIDMHERTYWWESSLDSFPSHPIDLVVTTVPRAESVGPAVAGRYIEPLLWRAGTGSGVLFTRVDPALRYKLRRWPDLAAMPHTAQQLRAITLLANAQLTTTEIATIADITEKDVRTLIGTFVLMSLIDAVKDPAAAR